MSLRVRSMRSFDGSSLIISIEGSVEATVAAAAAVAYGRSEERLEDSSRSPLEPSPSSSSPSDLLFIHSRSEPILELAHPRTPVTPSDRPSRASEAVSERAEKVDDALDET